MIKVDVKVKGDKHLDMKAVCHNRTHGNCYSCCLLHLPVVDTDVPNHENQKDHTKASGECHDKL
jgi:hypothetical protein